MAICFSAAPDRDGKDSLANIRATGELVVNLVSEDLAEAMNATAMDAPRGVDEAEIAGLETTPSVNVKPPRIARSPAAFECRLVQEIATGGSSTIVLARIVRAHVLREAFEDRARLHIDAAKLALIGRMNGGGGYCTTRDTFILERTRWQDR